MKILLRLAKASAKNIYRMVKSNSPFYCADIKKEVKVTKLFFNHIVNNAKKKRANYEILERILIIPFLEEIFLKGKISQIRNEEYGKTYRISYLKGADTLSAVIIKSSEVLLLSYFRKNSINEKRVLS